MGMNVSVSLVKGAAQFKRHELWYDLNAAYMEDQSL